MIKIYSVYATCACISILRYIKQYYGTLWQVWPCTSVKRSLLPLIIAKILAVPNCLLIQRVRVLLSYKDVLAEASRDVFGFTDDVHCSG